ncbi:MAG: DMT family transporter [Psychrilyobacter sp.]|nr:DMT family transporter [Psychrilyobacter sp.]
MNSKKNRNKGYLMVFSSTMFFYLMTVLVKFITVGENISGTQVSFFRFFIGFIIVNIGMMKNGYNIKMVNKKAVLSRAILSSLSILLFFIVIQHSTATKGNIYNLTYPIFVVALGPIFLKDEKWTLKSIIGVIISFGGILFISGIGFGSFEAVDILGIIMGTIAGLGIIALREARKTDDPNTILFYLMVSGLIITAIPFGNTFNMPTSIEWLYIIGMGTFSYLGQYTLTHGFKYVKAVEGSLISESRIFVSAICGVLFLGEKFTYPMFIGGILIFTGIVVVSVEWKKKKNITKV